MPTSRKTFALAIFVLVLAGGVAAGIWYALPVRRQGGLLTGAEITALVSGNTVKGAKFSEYYAPDGSIRGRFGVLRRVRRGKDGLAALFPALWIALSRR